LYNKEKDIHLMLQNKIYKDGGVFSPPN